MTRTLQRRHLLFGATLSPLLSRTARAAEPLSRILVVGNSQAQGLAAGLQRQFRGDGSWRVIDRSRIATGLCSPTRYDWPARRGQHPRGGARRHRGGDVRCQRPPASAPARPRRGPPAGVVLSLLRRACADRRRRPAAVVPRRSLGRASDRARHRVCRGYGTCEPAVCRAIDRGGCRLVPVLVAVHRRRRQLRALWPRDRWPNDAAAGG